MTDLLCEKQNLLNGIIESPNDVTKRLIYADWCEEYGDPNRAELIRLQIAISDWFKNCACGNTDPRHPRHPCTVRTNCKMMTFRWNGESSTDAMLRLTSDGSLLNWLVEEFGRHDYGTCEIYYNNGFPSYVELTLNAWEKIGGKLVKQLPVTDIRLKDKEPAASGWYNDNANQIGYIGGVDTGSFGWMLKQSHQEIPPTRFELQSNVWHFLKKQHQHYMEMGGCLFYDCKARALGALSDTLIEMAKSLLFLQK